MRLLAGFAVLSATAALPSHWEFGPGQDSLSCRIGDYTGFRCKINEKAMRYGGKIDWWIGLGVLTGILTPIAIAVTAKSLPMYAVFAGVCIIVFGFCFPQSYETTKSELVVRAGLRKIRIPYAQITHVGPSSDSRSALALSLDRVLIEYQSGAVLIAPENRSAFIGDVQAHAPQLSKRGQDLVLSLV
jgi:hypothetical protein